MKSVKQITYDLFTTTSASEMSETVLFLLEEWQKTEDFEDTTTEERTSHTFNVRRLVRVLSELERATLAPPNPANLEGFIPQ